MYLYTLCMMAISFITQTKTHVNIWPPYFFRILTDGDSFASANSSPSIRIYRNTQNKLFNYCNCDIG